MTSASRRLTKTTRRPPRCREFDHADAGGVSGRVRPSCPPSRLSGWLQLLTVGSLSISLALADPMASSRAILLLLAVASSACFGRGGGLFAAILGTAIVTAAVVSATEPPPPHVMYLPETRPGYAWQAGYWTREDDQWVWIDGQWVTLQPGYAWSPTHWEQEPEGSWRLRRGQWVPAPPSSWQ